MKGVNLGKISANGDVAKKGDYPVLPDPSGDVAKLVDDYIDLNAKKKAAEGGLKIVKGELGSEAEGLVPLARKFYLDVAHGKSDVPSSVEVCGSKEGVSVLVVMQNRYKGADEVAVGKVIGKANLDRYFHQHFEIKVDGDKVPEAVSQKLIDEIVALFAKHGCADALSAKSQVVPKPEFHEARHSVLSVDQNAKVDELCPLVVAVKER